MQDLAGRPRPLTGRLLGQEVPTIAVASEGKASERAPGKSSLPGPQMVYNSGRSECSGARRPGTVSAMPSGVQGPPILRCALLSATAQALHLRPAPKSPKAREHGCVEHLLALGSAPSAALDPCTRWENGCLRFSSHNLS